MEYKGYKLFEQKNSIVVENVKDFHPVHTFECGQCFRWHREIDGSYTGVAKSRAVRMNFSDGVLEIYNSTLQDFKEVWFNYLDLGRDYSEIKEKLAKDPVMQEAVKFGNGIRLLRQELWETLISFILSSNNIIPKIKRGVAAISKVYGSEISMEAQSYYAFPKPADLSGAEVKELEMCRGGYRCKYMVNTARMIVNGGLDLNGIYKLSTLEARKELEKFPGVGPKVADCVLLYSGTRYDVFPTDVWVKRVMEELYFKRDASFKEIQEFARDYFGELAGFAQQYLFYYAREKKIGAKSASHG